MSKLRKTPYGAVLFPRLTSSAERKRIGEILRKETVGGVLLVVAAAAAVLLANSPAASGYFALRDLEFGYEPWHLRLSLGAWAADGLLAIFFFLVGLELKREFVSGDLRNPKTAMIPVAAAIGGVIVPAVIYSMLVRGDSVLTHGWAIPTATDIAFAVAVLAIIGSRLPSALRIFLLTLAVVDDLIAIAIIAVFYSGEIQFAWLLAALATIAVYGVIAQKWRDFFGGRPFAAWLILLPIGVIAWAFMHASGIHATIAGVLLAFTIPVLHRTPARHGDSTAHDGRDGRDGHDEINDLGPGLAEQFEHRFRPLSAGIAVPIFAFFAAGVSIGGGEGIRVAFASPVTIAIIVALVIGKPLGIVATTWLTTRITRTTLDPSYRWVDLAGVGILAGIGFTVSLLVAELSFSSELAEHDYAKVAVLTASVLAAILAAIVLGVRNRQYAKISRVENPDPQE